LSVLWDIIHPSWRGGEDLLTTPHEGVPARTPQLDLGGPALKWETMGVSRMAHEHFTELKEWSERKRELVICLRLSRGP